MKLKPDKVIEMDVDESAMEYPIEVRVTYGACRVRLNPVVYIAYGSSVSVALSGSDPHILSISPVKPGTTAIVVAAVLHFGDEEIDVQQSIQVNVLGKTKRSKNENAKKSVRG